MRPCAVALISAKELERLCRYITRPAIANHRLTRNPAGQVVLQLKSPYRDGTTHIVLSPLEFMQRLGALVPRPRLHLIGFHGVLAPHATLRAFLFRGKRKTLTVEKVHLYAVMKPDAEPASPLSVVLTPPGGGENRIEFGLR